MKILFLGIGKTSQEHLKEGVERYKKLLGPYACIEEHYLKEEDKRPDPVAYESEKLIGKIPDNYFSVLLDISGDQMSSEDFAELIRVKRDSSVPGIVFVIGGSDGVSEALRKRCSARISFSRMTFTHQMIRLLLAEQIYRAFCIIMNRKYHK